MDDKRTSRLLEGAVFPGRRGSCLMSREYRFFLLLELFFFSVFVKKYSVRRVFSIKPGGGGRPDTRTGDMVIFYAIPELFYGKRRFLAPKRVRDQSTAAGGEGPDLSLSAWKRSHQKPFGGQVLDCRFFFVI